MSCDSGLKEALLVSTDGFDLWLRIEELKLVLEVCVHLGMPLFAGISGIFGYVCIAPSLGTRACSGVHLSNAGHQPFSSLVPDQAVTRPV